MRPDVRTTRPIRALVIGAGPAAVAMHLPVLAAQEKKRDVELALICDIDGSRVDTARRNFGFSEACGDAHAALARPDIDAVYIFGSAQMHYEYGMRALESGKHLFVEKPIAPSYAQACEIASAAQRFGLIAAGGHNRRFYKSLTFVREQAGKSGWRFGEAVFHKAEFGRRALFGARSWLSANGIHALDALVFMMGRLPERLATSAEDAVAEEPTSFAALMSWPDRSQAVFLCNNNAGERSERYAFHGLGETYSVRDSEVSRAANGVVTRTAFDSIGDGIAAEHDAFVHAIRAGSQPIHSFAALAPSLFLAELIEAGFNGCVTLPEPLHAAPATSQSRASDRKTVLVVRPAELQPALSRLGPDFGLISAEDLRQSSRERPDVVAAILGRGSPPLPAEILAKVPNLEIVGVTSLSVAPYTPEHLLARGIRIVNASAAHADSVAEFSLGLAILGRRRAFSSHEVMRNGGWGVGATGSLARRVADRLRPAIRAIGLEPVLLRMWRAWRATSHSAVALAVHSSELRGATVGLIGWSANARAFAERLLHHGARVVVYSEHASENDIRQASVTRVSLTEALSADVVSLHRGLTAHTRYFLGAAELEKLRPGCVLINVARGALIEPGALLARLKRGDCFACLDTYDEEPLPASHPLRKLRNVFLTSHIAGGCGDMRVAAAHEVIQKIEAHLSGEAVQYISAERLRTMT